MEEQFSLFRYKKSNSELSQKRKIVREREGEREREREGEREGEREDKKRI